MKDNLHKSKINILSSNKIRNCIQSISLTSARKKERTVRQRMQTWNTTESDSVSRHRNVQKSKHQDFESRNVHKLAACSSEHAAKQDHVTQLSQRLYAENQTSMQTDMHSSDECQLHHFSLSHHQESDTSEQLNSRRRENTVKTWAISSRCDDFC